MPKQYVPAAPDTWAVYEDDQGHSRRYLVVAWAIDERGRAAPVGAVAEPGSAIAPHAWIWTPGAGRPWASRPEVPEPTAEATAAAARSTKPAKKATRSTIPKRASAGIRDTKF
jgi:hypothetical protein